MHGCPAASAVGAGIAGAIYEQASVKPAAGRAGDFSNHLFGIAAGGAPRNAFRVSPIHARGMLHPAGTLAMAPQQGPTWNPARPLDEQLVTVGTRRWSRLDSSPLISFARRAFRGRQRAGSVQEESGPGRGRLFGTQGGVKSWTGSDRCRTLESRRNGAISHAACGELGSHRQTSPLHSIDCITRAR